MKILFSPTDARRTTRHTRAFTMAEMVITVGVFMLLMGGILYGYLFGLNLFQITKIKLGASDDARKALIRLTDEIRSANQVQIGAGNLTSFLEDATNGVQVGFAMQIYPDTNHNNWIRYWYETNSADTTNFTKLLRTTDGTNFQRTMPHAITNRVPIFSSEDPAGNYLTNNLNNRVIGVTLQFYQIEYPIVMIGTNNYYDFYQLHTRITRRTLY
ncbi:MAG: hypothetical protein JWR69_4322 [Pedosphaera sp.]|nr:hypothetical protein [Pedosphaera sp.]